MPWLWPAVPWMLTLDGRTKRNVSRLQQGRRHGETQAVPLSVMEGNHEADLGGFAEVGTKGKNFEGGLEMSMRRHVKVRRSAQASGSSPSLCSVVWCACVPIEILAILFCGLWFLFLPHRFFDISSSQWGPMRVAKGDGAQTRA